MLERIYQLLCHIYCIQEPEKIRDYLRAQNSLSKQEELIIAEFPDGQFELALHLDPQLEKMTEQNPLQHVHELCLLTEGLSHFLFITERIHAARSTSLLEMELQAEVDKFLILHLLSWEQEQHCPPKLFAQQFEEHRFAEHLNGAEFSRYQTAHQFAAKFCHRLRERYIYPLKMRELISAAREFFSHDFYHKVKTL